MKKILSLAGLAAVLLVIARWFSFHHKGRAI